MTQERKAGDGGGSGGGNRKKVPVFREPEDVGWVGDVGLDYADSGYAAAV